MGARLEDSLGSVRHVSGLAALERGGALQPWSFKRRSLRPDDVGVEILFCGVCHTDLHALGKWGQAFPLVPGHEIVGRVTGRGGAVTNFEVGDLVAIGTIVDSCRTCAPCVAEEESYCLAFPTTTFDGVDRVDGGRTRGGYSTYYVCDQRFVYHVPDGLDLPGTAPLLCAGVTTFAALRHWRAGPGVRVGVVGIGGLGHLAVKFAAAFGAHVVAFTRSADKAETAAALGAHEAILTTDPEQMRSAAYSLDLVIDTVAEGHPLNDVMQTLKLDGTLVSLGIPDTFDVQPFLLAMARRTIASSGTGGTRVTNEMLQFCAEHGIVADVELIRPDEISSALTRLERGDVRYRFVLDLRRGIDGSAKEREDAGAWA